MKSRKTTFQLAIILVFFLGNIASINAQSYCTVSSTPWNYWMTKVSIGSTSFTSSKEAYGNFVSSTFTVDRGQANTLTLESFGSDYVPNSTVYWAAWIDFNGNGVFTDAGEMVINPSTATKVYNYPLGGMNNAPLADRQASATISVPTGATNGTKRMRVMFKSGSAPASNGCETVAVGEVEDYTVNITGTTTGGCTSAPTLTCPVNISVTAASGATSATANFMTATASSPCGSSTSVGYTINGSSVTSSYAFPVGSTTVTVNATHISNNFVAVCSFTVVVTAGTTGNPTTSTQWSGGTLSTDNIFRMGRVAIGTTNFGSDNTFNLLVRGGIRTEKIKMDVASANQWADYVFAKGYDLKPLKEVKQYIDKNKHLPNIPSAEELVKQGLDVMQMMAKQQEKIEELYLYMIQLNETIAKQQAEIKALKAMSAKSK
jgi:GEVED domain/HYR domain